jgi:acyl-CoA thioesterase
MTCLQGTADLAYFQSGAGFPWRGRDFPFYEFMGLNDLSFLRVEDGLAAFKAPVLRNHLNVHNTVHGGVLATLADIGCLLAVRSNMPLEELQTLKTYTQNLRIDYLANVGEGYLIVLSKVISRLRTFCLVEVDIRDARNNLLVRAVGQIFMGKREPDSRR